MKIGIVGGTGPLGRGLALRWALAGHDVHIGSRDAQKALETAKTLQEMIQEAQGTGRVTGAENKDVADSAEIVVLAVPASMDSDMLERLQSSLQGKVLIDCTVALDPQDITRVADGHTATAVKLQQRLGENVTVIAGFHTVAAAKLLDLSHTLSDDTFFAGDDAAAKDVAQNLAKEIGLRPFDVGPLENGATLERITALLIGMNKRYRRRGIGIKLTGV